MAFLFPQITQMSADKLQASCFYLRNLREMYWESRILDSFFRKAEQNCYR